MYAGAPEYERWYKLNTSGLIYSTAYCHPGSKRGVQVVVDPGGTFQRYLPVCSACPTDSTSGGGLEASCLTCLVRIAPYFWSLLTWHL